MSNEKRRLLILGLGNPIVSDDALGFVVLDELEKRINRPEVTLVATQTGGLSFIDLVAGYDVLIIIDAIKTGKHEPGTIVEFSPEEYAVSPRGAAVHDVSFFQALELGRRMNFKIPENIHIIAVEVVDTVNIREEMTPAVERAVPAVVEKVTRLASDLGFGV